MVLLHPCHFETPIKKEYPGKRGSGRPLEMDNWGQRWRKQGRPGMNSDGLPKTGLGGGALSTSYAPLGAKRVE